jgi:hypothetical protein
MNIDSISWPDDADVACKFYLGFLIDVVGGMEFRFPDFAPDPLETAKAYVEGKVSQEEYRSQAALWWEHLDSTGAIREMRDPSALAARLAICLLSATADQAAQLGEHLSWFLEVLGFLGIDLAEPIRKMEGYFGNPPNL